MIYGINFNGSLIPDGVRKKFAAYTDAKGRSVGADRSCAWRLIGVATSAQEKDAMLIQATNGHRKLRVVERKTAGASFFGVYAG